MVFVVKILTSLFSMIKLKSQRLEILFQQQQQWCLALKYRWMSA